jgi:hypothetical protein
MREAGMSRKFLWAYAAAVGCGGSAASSAPDAGNTPSDASLDATADTASAVSDASSDASDVTSDSAPAPTCSPGPTTPVQLATIDAPSMPTLNAIVVSGGFVYYGVQDLTDPSQAPTGAIFSVPIAGGTPNRIMASDYVIGQIAADGANLYYGKAVSSSSAPGSWSTSTSTVLALPVGNGPVQALPNPPGTVYVAGIMTNGTPGVLWRTPQSVLTTPGAIVRWTPSSDLTTSLYSTTGILGMLADADTIYWQASPDAQSDVGLYSMPIAGGTPNLLRHAPAPSKGGPVQQLLGLDATHLVFSPDGSGGAISRMDKSGGNEAVIVPSGAAIGRFHVDDTWVYWGTTATVDSGIGQNEVLTRVRIAGGTPETIAQAAVILGITSDACNVYWTVVNPPAVMMQAK